MDGEAVTRLPGRAETPQHGRSSSGTVLGVTGGSRASPGSRQAGCLSTAAPSCFAASNVLQSHITPPWTGTACWYHFITYETSSFTNFTMMMKVMRETEGEEPTASEWKISSFRRTYNRAKKLVLCSRENVTLAESQSSKLVT